MGNEMGQETLRLLIIEDSEADHLLYKRSLEKTEGESYDLVETYTGDEGLDALETKAFDCILLDYGLPDMDGQEVIERIFEKYDSPPPIIVMTGQGSEKLAVKSLQLGVKDYLPKDQINPSSLSRSIQNAVEKAQLQEEVAQKQRAIEQFAYTAAHDLYAPLRRINAFCELLNKESADTLNENSQAYLEHIMSNSQRVMKLVDDILAYTKAGWQTEKMEKVNLNSIIHHIVEDHAIPIRERSVQLQASPLPVVEGNETILTLLFQNLISNAIKFSDKTAPQIHVDLTEEKDNAWVFAIRDNGIGIPQESLEEIFQPFARLNSEAQFPGSGIGLATCAKILEKAGGRIWAESSLGAGATFFVELKKA